MIIGCHGKSLLSIANNKNVAVDVNDITINPDEKVKVVKRGAITPAENQATAKFVKNSEKILPFK